MKPLASAWLVTWESVGENKPSPPVGGGVLAVLNYRWSSNRVRDFVEQLYAALTGGPSDKIAFARNPKANPYRVIYGTVDRVPNGDVMHCGYNPSVHARRVRNVRLEVVD